jgi:hypothetical protein
MRHAGHLKKWTEPKKPCGELVYKHLNSLHIATIKRAKAKVKQEKLRIVE